LVKSCKRAFRALELPAYRMVSISSRVNKGSRARLRSVAADIGVLLVSGMLVGVTMSAPTHAAERATHMTRTLDGADSATLHLVRPGERLLEEGAVTGALPGRMRAELNIGPVYKGSFTIYTRNGRINGIGTATPHGAGRYQSFAGWLNVTSGSGLYAHVHGRNHLYGVFDRRTYAVTIKTTGSLTY
jgi:hypothetical protein